MFFTLTTCDHMTGTPYPAGPSCLSLPKNMTVTWPQICCSLCNKKGSKIFEFSQKYQKNIFSLSQTKTKKALKLRYLISLSKKKIIIFFYQNK